MIKITRVVYSHEQKRLRYVILLYYHDYYDNINHADRVTHFQTTDISYNFYMLIINNTVIKLWFIENKIMIKFLAMIVDPNL